MKRLRQLCLGLSLLALSATAQATVYTIGTGTQTLDQTGVSPFSNLYEDNRTQYLFRASELTAAGATAGTINSLGFNFITLTSMAAENVHIKMGMTSNTTLSGITEGLTEVYASSSIMPVAGWNTFTFTTPFNWDGVSNLIIEVCRDNNDYDDDFGVQGKQYPAGEFLTFAYYADGAAGCSLNSGDDLTNSDRRRRPNIQLDIVAGTPCSGTPVAGLTTAMTSVCATDNFSLTATPSFATGITFEYQVSTDGGTTWTSLGAPGVNSFYNVSGQTTASLYRVIVACATGGADTSSSVPVAQSAVTECYCIPAYTDGCIDGDDIDNFVLMGDAGTGINHLGSGCSLSGYGDFTSMSVTMTPGMSYPGTLTSSFPSEWEAYNIWVDWNNNGLFETSEMIATGTGIGGTTAGNFTVIPPVTAVSGAHRMRVRMEFDFPIDDPCATGEYGETHDYTIMIAATCTTPVVSLGADSTACSGDVITLDAGNPGLSFAWSTGETTQSINVTTAGTYSVTVTDGACAASDTIVVGFDALPVVDLGMDTSICSDATLTLDAGNTGASFTWSTGDTSQMISVTTAGTYSVLVENGACVAADTIMIEEVPAPVAATIEVVDNMPDYEFSAPGTTGAMTYAWDFGDGATAETETASHTYTANGTYTVTLLVTSACGQSGSVTTAVTVSGVGVDAVNTQLSQVSVYPNPSSGLTVVEAKGATIKTLEVVNNLGRVVLRHQPDNAKASFDVKGMAQGIYTIRVQTSKGLSTLKLVVKD